MLFTCGRGRKKDTLLYYPHIKVKALVNARMFPTINSKKNQACCRAPSLMLPLLTTHWRASSSWKSLNKQLKLKHMDKIMGEGNNRQRWKIKVDIVRHQENKAKSNNKTDLKTCWGIRHEIIINGLGKVQGSKQ